MLIKKIETYTDFWREIVELDYNAYKAQIDDIRLVFHLAISLFHMADWIYIGNKAQIDSSFTFKDKNGVSQPVYDEKTFANSLRDINSVFELIRGIANASKHLERRPQAVQSAKAHHGYGPSHAANTAVHATGYGTGGYGVGPYGGTPRVMLEGPGGNLLEFVDIAEEVRQMWKQQATTHNWIL